MLTEIAKSLPNPILNNCIQSYVGLERAFERNRIEYQYQDKALKYVYDDVPSFKFFRNKIEKDKTSEGIPIEKLNLSSDVDEIYDIGAHFGLYSVILGKLNPKKKLYCFEPIDENRRILEKNIRYNSIDAAIRPEAISNESGKRDFFRNSQNPHSVSHGTYPSESSERIELPFEKLSNVVGDEAESVFLKIDAEGEEQKILEDAFENCNHIQISGIVEIHPTKMSGGVENITDLFNDYHFNFYKISNTTPDMDFDFPAYYFDNHNGC